MVKTNAIRLLESLGVPHGVLSYECREVMDAVAVAGCLGVPAERVFKTLVARGEGVLVFCVPGGIELDLRKAARAAGVKKVEMVPVREILPLTGYVRGGCSPVGMKRDYPLWIDETAQLHEWILVSAGAPGLQIRIDPAVLAALRGARFAELT